MRRSVNFRKAAFMRHQAAPEEICSAPAAALGFTVLFNQESTINQPGQAAANQWANPIDDMVVPMATGQGWTEGSRGVHRSAGERSTEENIQGNGQADCQAAYFWRTRIHRAAV